MIVKIKSKVHGIIEVPVDVPNNVTEENATAVLDEAVNGFARRVSDHVNGALRAKQSIEVAIARGSTLAFGVLDAPRAASNGKGRLPKGAKRTIAFIEEAPADVLADAVSRLTPERRAELAELLA